MFHHWLDKVRNESVIFVPIYYASVKLRPVAGVGILQRAELT